MKKIHVMFMLALVASLIAACSEQPKDTSTTGEPTIQLDKTELTLTNWKVDNTHMEKVSGKVLVGDNPVENAVVQITNKRTVETDEKGEFSLLVSRNIIDNKTIHIINADNAELNGKKIDETTKKELLKLEKNILIHYPIEIDKVVANVKDNNLVDVHARVGLDKDHDYPAFGPEKYKVGGTIKDADGNPVSGATVNMRRDGVEGFTMSDPSGTDGKFSMYYVPEDDENHYFFVHHNGTTYTLPPRKVYVFPEDISVNIDIVLPKEGTIIEDKPPTLVTTTAPGALYKGTLIGVNVDKSVKYTINIPNRDGTFILTLPKSEWDKNLTFFQTSFRDFLLEAQKAGDVISSDFIPAPKANEPNEITAKETK